MTDKEPDYYAGNGLSPIGAFQQGLMSKDEYIGFIKGNIIKYVVRAGHKDDAIKDLMKARNYIDFYLELLNPNFNIKEFTIEVNGENGEIKKEVKKYD